MSRRMIPLALLALLVPLAACESEVVQPAADQVESLAFAMGGPEYADVMNQNGVGVYAANGAAVVRQTNGARISMTVPTPVPGTYVYPANGPGHPEVFTLWAFIFNYPWLCSPPGCGGDDLGTATGANGGVYNVGGHVGAGRMMTITGRIGVGEAPVAFSPLESPATAEYHVALAPHGGLDPSLVPNEFRIPVGSPVCGCWWVAIFD